MHTINISPNLYLRRINSCTHQRCTIIASSTSKIVDFTFAVGANKPLRDIELAFIFN